MRRENQDGDEFMTKLIHLVGPSEYQKHFSVRSHIWLVTHWTSTPLQLWECTSETSGSLRHTEATVSREALEQEATEKVLRLQR